MAAKPRAVFIIGVIAVIVAGAASFYLMQFLKTQEEKAVEAIATQKVLVAARDISMGMTIDAQSVKMAEWPKAGVPESALLSTGEAVGRVALMRITPGDPITNAKLLPIGGPPGMLSYKIPEGHRAMTVGVDRVSGVAGFISPGNKVDVVVVSQAGKKEPMSKIILQNVPVLATGMLIEQAPDGKPVEVPTVTMDLTPEEAEKLALASNQGSLRLLLRRAGDAGDVMTAGVTLNGIWEEGKKPERPRVAKKMVAKVARKATAVKVAKKTVKRSEFTKVNVEVLRNGDRTVETFKVKEEEL